MRALEKRLLQIEETVAHCTLSCEEDIQILCHCQERVVVEEEEILESGHYAKQVVVGKKCCDEIDDDVGNDRTLFLVDCIEFVGRLDEVGMECDQNVEHLMREDEVLFDVGEVFEFLSAIHGSQISYRDGSMIGCSGPLEIEIQIGGVLRAGCHFEHPGDGMNVFPYELKNIQFIGNVRRQHEGQWTANNVHRFISTSAVSHVRLLPPVVPLPFRRRA